VTIRAAFITRVSRQVVGLAVTPRWVFDLGLLPGLGQVRP
jgi:hypothetical protein